MIDSPVPCALLAPIGLPSPCARAVQHEETARQYVDHSDPIVLVIPLGGAAHHRVDGHAVRGGSVGVGSSVGQAITLVSLAWNAIWNRPISSRVTATGQPALMPPSTTRLWPLINLDASLARNSAA